MVPKASHAHGNTLLTFAIGPAFCIACVALDLAVRRLDFGPIIGGIIPLPSKNRPRYKTVIPYPVIPSTLSWPNR